MEALGCINLGGGKPKFPFRGWCPASYSFLCTKNYGTVDVINVDTMRCVGKSNAGCVWGGLLSELIIPRTKNN